MNGRITKSTLLGACLALLLAGGAQAGPVGPMPAPTSNAAPPSISGTPLTGQVLASNVGTWDGSPTPSFTRQWRRCTPVEPAVISAISVNSLNPNQIAVDANGDAYIAAAQIWKIPASGAAPTALPGTTDASGPITVDQWGNIYTINPFTESVMRVDSGSGSVTTFGSTGVGPSAIAVDRRGIVYVANFNDDTVSKLFGGDPSADQTIAVPHNGAHGYPMALTVDPSNNVFVANFQDQGIVKIDAAGSATMFAAYIGARPAAIATDVAGKVYVGGEGGLAVSIPAGGGGATSLGSTTDDHYGIAVDRNGDVWVTDRGGASLTQFPVGGGTPVTFTGIGAQPMQLAIDSSGNVFTANGVGGAAGASVTKLKRNNCADVAGATGSSYSLGGADAGSRIQLKVTGTNIISAATAFSALTPVVTPPPQVPFVANSLNAALIGAQSVGNQLTYVAVEWGGYPTPTVTFDWLRCDAAEIACTPIGTPDSQTYTLIHADAGMKIVVEETATNSQGSTTNRIPSGLITEAPANSALPSVSGPALIGSLLTADSGSWDAYPSAALSVQWQRCDAGGDNCSDIPGATGGSRANTADDLGHTIRVGVTATNPVGSGTVFSSATAVIAASPSGDAGGGGTPAKLGVAVKPPKRVRRNRPFKLRVNVNTATGLTNVKACVKLPRGIRVVRRAHAKVARGRACWSRGALAAGASARYTITLKAGGRAPRRLKFAATARAEDAAGAKLSASGNVSVKLR